MDILNSCWLSYTSSPFCFSAGMAPGLTRGDALPQSHSPALASVPMYSPSCQSLCSVSVDYLLTSDSSLHFPPTFFIPVLHFYCCGKDREQKQRGGERACFSFPMEGSQGRSLDEGADTEATKRACSRWLSYTPQGWQHPQWGGRAFPRQSLIKKTPSDS